MSKVWSWLKKHWKWVVFPIGILSAILGWLLWWGGQKPKDDQASGTSDKAADKAVEDISKAQDVKERAVQELEEKHADKIEALSSDQQKEWEEIKKKPVDEVASWIDNL